MPKVPLKPKQLANCMWENTSFSACHQQYLSSSWSSKNQNQTGGADHTLIPVHPRIPNEKTGLPSGKMGRPKETKRNLKKPNPNLFVTKTLVTTSLLTFLNVRPSMGWSQAPCTPEPPGTGAGEGPEYNPKELSEGEMPIGN